MNACISETEFGLSFVESESKSTNITFNPSPLLSTPYFVTLTTLLEISTDIQTAVDSNSLANAILKMSQIDGYIRHQMGLNNRKKVMEKFDEQLIISDYLNIIKAVGTEKGSSDKH